MTAGRSPSRFRHEAVVYASDEELLDVAVPFIRDGAEAGDAVVLHVDDRRRAMVVAALDDPDAVTVTSPNGASNAFTALEAKHRLLRGLLGDGTTTHIRVLGQIAPFDGVTDWDDWARPEAAVNHLFAPLDVWWLCPFDARATPDRALAHVERTHPHLTADAGRPNAGFSDPAAFLAECARRPADPLEATPPLVVERDPTPRDARRAIAALAASTTIDAATVDGLVLAVSEVVTNALVHGVAPVDVRAWAARDRVVVTVRDRGAGPPDPFVGFLPRGDRPGGLGLWMAHQACSRVAMLRDADGFTVRLTAGPPPP